MIKLINDKKNIKLIPAKTGNNITDMWECNERFLSVDYWPLKRKGMFSDMDKLNKMIKVNKIINIIK